jgi:hypothetical protein
VAALAPKLTTGEQSRARRQETSSIEAYDHFLRGVALFYEYRKDSNAMARQMFERAIALDPNYARAYVWLSWGYFIDWEFQWTEGPDHWIGLSKQRRRPLPWMILCQTPTPCWVGVRYGRENTMSR